VLLSSYGRREWGIATVIAVLIAIPALLVGLWWSLIPIVICWIAVAGFFRDPLGRRPATQDPHDLISPADGKISLVERLDSHEATDGQPAVLVRIFLSVLDVHINRAPCDAEVISITHRPGRYLDARSEESAKVNESNLIVFKSEDGEPIGVRQVSGAIARRIVCPLAAGDRVGRGDRFGMIKFGSTTELIVRDRPGVEVLVSKGQRVTGGVTVLLRQPASGSSPTAVS
jgi:phosphatidylserine decarboxylase